MLDPITIGLIAGGASSLGSGLFQWLNSKEAQRASAEERARIQELANKIQEPTFNTADINPQELKVLQQYSPQIASLVPEKSPELVKALSEGAQRGRSAQLGALDKYQQLAQTGNDPLLQLEQARAQRAAQAQAQSATANIDELNQRRGINVGSGIGLAQKLQSIQNSQLQQALAGEQANANAYQRQMLNLQNAANLGGQVRNEDVDLEQRNANAINDFNQRMAQIGNQYNQYAANTANQAQQFNIGQNQNVANQNIQNRYNAALNNRNTQNSIAQQKYGNKLDMLGIQSGLSNQRSQDYLNNAAINNRGIQAASDAINTGALAYGSYKQRQQDEDDGQKKYGRGY